MNVFRQRAAQASRLGALTAAGALAIGLAASPPVLAQTSEWSTQPPVVREVVGDPPARAGRLSQVEGSAWLQHPASGEWIAAQRNRPLTTGDRLSTEAGSRLEWEVGSTAIRLDESTEIEIARLDDDVVELELTGGSVAVRVRNPDVANGVSLATGEGLFTVLRSGSYRLDRRDGTSRLTVWSGQARYERGGNALSVQQGQSAEFWIDAGSRAQYSLATPQIDRFTGWTGDLDRAADQALAGRHVSPEMTGADDLDRHGRWSQDPEYGALWTPNDVPSNWSPYAAGHWTWVSPWGWTWVDDMPWGFAPFHYGRWVMAGDRWRWAPGRYVARPVYAPALVAWIGGHPRPPHLGGRDSGISWIPLAPREAYVPSYRYSRGHVRDVNAPHFHHPRDVERVIQTPHVERGPEYRNRKFHHGTTTIPLIDHERRHGRIGGPLPGRGERPFHRDPDRTVAPGVGIGTQPPALEQGSPWRRDRSERIGRSDRDEPRRRGDGPREGAGAEWRNNDGSPREWGGGVRSDRRFERREGDGWQPPGMVGTLPATRQPPPAQQPPVNAPQLQAPSAPPVTPMQPPMVRAPGAEMPSGNGSRGRRDEQDRPFARPDRPRMERGEGSPFTAPTMPPPAAPMMQPPAAPGLVMQAPSAMPQRPPMRSFESPREARPAGTPPGQMSRPGDDTPRNRRDPRQQP